MRSDGIALSHALWALGSLCALHQKPFSADLLARELPVRSDGTVDTAILLSAGPALGFRVKTVTCSAKSLPKLPLPLLIELQQSDAASTQLGLVTAVAQERCVLFVPGQGEPQQLDLVDLLRQSAGKAWVFAPELAAPTDEDAAQTGTQSFGFRWFVPEMLRHKKVWRDVLLASLALQIIALRAQGLHVVAQSKHLVAHSLPAICSICSINCRTCFASALDRIAEGQVAADGLRVAARQVGRPQGCLCRPGPVASTVFASVEGRHELAEVEHRDLSIHQAIIDKVIVHRTQSTLITIGIAMGLFLVLSGLLSWARQYLVLHTGNRVDAVLGAAVWDHLLKLPLRYFEHRPTGVVAARLNAVESIREFVSGAAISLLLDLPFLLICLAVMLYYSVALTALAVGVLAVIAVASFIMAPIFQKQLNDQFLLGARNQAFVTEHIAGFETVKTLQMEPQLRHRYSGYLATLLASAFRTKQIANTYNTFSTTMEQAMTLGILVMGAYMVMNPQPGAAPFTVGMLVAFQMFAGRGARKAPEGRLCWRNDRQ